MPRVIVGDQEVMLTNKTYTLEKVGELNHGSVVAFAQKQIAETLGGEKLPIAAATIIPLAHNGTTVCLLFYGDECHRDKFEMCSISVGPHYKVMVPLRKGTVLFESLESGHGAVDILDLCTSFCTDAIVTFALQHCNGGLRGEYFVLRIPTIPNIRLESFSAIHNSLGWKDDAAYREFVSAVSTGGASRQAAAIMRKIEGPSCISRMAFVWALCRGMTCNCVAQFINDRVFASPNSRPLFYAAWILKALQSSTPITAPHGDFPRNLCNIPDVEALFRYGDKKVRQRLVELVEGGGKDAFWLFDNLSVKDMMELYCIARDKPMSKTEADVLVQGLRLVRDSFQDDHGKRDAISASILELNQHFATVK